MEAIITGVNWLAVAISTVLSFGLGAFWYSQMAFGKKWAEGVGLDTEANAKQPVGALLTQFVGTFLMAWIVALAVALDAVSAGVLIVIAIAVLLVAGGMFHGNSRFANVTEGGFVLAMAVIMFGTNTIL